VGQILTHRKNRSAAEFRSASEIRQEIFEQLLSRIKLKGNEKVFPYKNVVVLLQPRSRSLSEAFESAFIQNGSLKSDIAQSLQDSKARYSGEMEVSVELLKDFSSGHSVSEESPPEPLFQISLQPDSMYWSEVPEIILVVSNGSAKQQEYRIRKERILIGCGSEVEDREGRMVRRNDVVFLDNGDDINSTVSDIHARIWFNFEKQEFFIMDEGSRYGTRIVRKGRSIDVPSVHDQGILLQSGDEIYCGRASLILGTDREKS
jgi:hypothetical protein